LALLLLILGVGSPCFAQNAQKIVDEYVHAEGGSKALAKIQTASITGSLVDDATGQSGTYSLITKAPNKFYSEIIIEPHRLIEAYNGKSAWGQDTTADSAPANASSNAKDAPHTLTGAVATEWEAAGLYLNSRLADAKKSKFGLQLVGTEDIGGRKAYHLRVTLSPRVSRELFFDSQTHLLIREVIPATARQQPESKSTESKNEIAEELDYADYRRVDGVEAPYRITLRRAGRVYTITVSRIEWNAPVNDSVFDFPNNKSRPLPDIKSLLLDVAKNQKAIEELQKQYTCHVAAEEEKFDSKGQITSREVKEYDVFNCGGDEIRHLVKDDSKPLTAEQQHKEDDRFNKEFSEFQKKQAELANDPKKQEKEDERQQTQVSDFLRAESFTNPRRERFRGQDVIVFDFGPNPDYKPRKLAESIVQKLVGVVWIDEEARDVARLEARFSENAKIGGGLLASVDKGTNLVIEQTKINGEVWLPSYAEVHAAARVVFVRVRQNEIDRYGDYKKFRVETKIGPSTPVTERSQQPEPAPTRAPKP
jgi:outer membrane lipoprotein-sorting protein